MRVLVCGGRDYRDAVRFRNEMSRIHSKLGISHLIHGDALGADRLADAWALMCGIPVTAYPANWYPDGKDGGRDDKAGLRNAMPGCSPRGGQISLSPFRGGAARTTWWNGLALRVSA